MAERDRRWGESSALYLNDAVKSPRLPVVQSMRPSIDRREALRRAALLVGGALSAPTVAALLAGCEAPPRAARLPRALSPDQETLVATIADHIIPPTDTPGARDVGVAEFIDGMLAQYAADDRARFLAGLADVDARARRAHGARFVDCAPGARHALLATLDEEAFAHATPAVAVPGRSNERGQTENATADQGSARSHPPFFRVMKELTLLGYYTSEAGATRELRYARIPGRFDGCVPFATVGRAWSV